MSHASAGREPLLELRGISKSFGHISAVSDVDMEVRPGEVLAVVGDNGAGKSTLMNVVIGLYRQTAGSILVSGVEQHFASPAAAAAAGISAVTQDLGLVECLDVATNMFIGRNPHRAGWVSKRTMDAEARAFLTRIEATVPDVHVPVGMLSGGQRQMITIARALRTGAELIVMDEPTAALGVRETAQVAELLGRLRAQGTSVMLVCHDMGLVFDVADRVQVMRHGRSVGVVEVAGSSKTEVIGLITGAIEIPVDVHA
jgi:ABC-type sugar transport system ATPase subunit